MSFEVFLNLFGAGILTLVVPPLTVGLLGSLIKLPNASQRNHKFCDFKVPAGWQSLFGVWISYQDTDLGITGCQEHKDIVRFRRCATVLLDPGHH